MATSQDATPAYECPQCSSTFRPSTHRAHCTECGYVPRLGSD